MIISPHEFDAIMKKDLMSFIHRCFNELNPETQFLSNWHIEQIAAKLEQVAQGKITRLIINLPPRNLKSIAASVGFPAWFLGHNPSKHIIAASYGQDLANKFARDTRAIMLTPWYQRVFPTRVSLQQRAADDFATVQGGSRMATSVGGTLTGRGADIIVIDDAMKPEDALSEVVRTRANSWLDSTVLSRLNNKETGAIVIIMQRLHQDDLVGHVLEQAANWEVLSFPAIAEHDELHVIENALGRRTVVRKAGEALHAARESVAGLEAQRRSMGDYNFSAQYQQNPAPEGGAMVKLAWIRYYVPFGIVDALDIFIKRLLRSRGFDLNRRLFIRGRLLDFEIDGFLGSAKRRHPVPAASREYDVDQGLEIFPVQVSQRFRQHLDHRVSRSSAFYYDGLLDPVDTTKKIILGLDRANCTAIRANLGQAGAQ
jgi:hypothetical protein